jgi:hypothetical protein
MRAKMKSAIAARSDGVKRLRFSFSSISSSPTDKALIGIIDAPISAQPNALAARSRSDQPRLVKPFSLMVARFAPTAKV